MNSTIIEGIREGLESVRQGKGTPAREFFAELRREGGIPPRSQRKLKGITAGSGPALTSEDIAEARREMWHGYMGEDEE